MDVDTDRISVEEVARRLGVGTGLIERLIEARILDADAAGRLDPGDVHRVRLLAEFETAGVPLSALLAADRAGRISLRYYDELHPAPTSRWGHTYGDFAGSLGSAARHLPGLYAAFGLAEPTAETLLDLDTETLLLELLAFVQSNGEPDLGLRAVRVFGEAARRATDSALSTYEESVSRSGLDVGALPIDEAFRAVLEPWARFSRGSATLAGWLVSRHLTRAIDAYSVSQTEDILAADGYVAPRPVHPPAIAFVDLTGFTRLTQERGDESAAGIALRLGEVATDASRPHGGRLVKLLGDGALVRFDDLAGAVEGVLDLLEALPAAALPSGHAGVASGYVIDRDNDVFGRTVNLAARIGDAAADGELLLPRADAEMLGGDARYTLARIDALALQGIGIVEVASVRRSAITRPPDS